MALVAESQAESFMKALAEEYYSKRVSSMSFSCMNSREIVESSLRPFGLSTSALLIAFDFLPVQICFVTAAW